MAQGHIRQRSPGLGLLGIIVAAVIPFSIALLANVFLPHQPSPWPDLVPGAIVMAIGVLALHLVTVYWITHLLEAKSEAYGAIGAALAILFWAYLLGRVLAASAVLNAGAWQQRHSKAQPLPPPPPPSGPA